MMGATGFILLAVLFTTVAAQRPTLTWAEVGEAKESVLQLIDDNSEGNGRGKEFPFIAGFVRVAFHDCVGGCDGCLNMNNDGNRGLARYTSKLDELYASNNYSSIFSRADFWMLAAITALKRANEEFDDSILFFGRKDCDTSPSTNETRVFPNPNWGIEKTVTYFNDTFGFTAQETVAILGAHVLGKKHISNSGYVGKWVMHGGRNGSLLSNEFYKQMRGQWVQKEISAFSGSRRKKFLWFREGVEPEINMTKPNSYLNSDLSLSWDIEPVDSDGKVSCTVNCARSTNESVSNECCPRSSTHRQFRNYVNSNSLWLQDFTDVFLTMIGTGSGILLPPSTGY